MILDKTSKTDVEVQRDVLDELTWEPTLDAARFGVMVEDGIVTLYGTVKSHHEKQTAERIAKRIVGVQAVVDRLEIQLPGPSERGDTELARAVVGALLWEESVPHERLSVTVEGGEVILDGEVNFHFERASVEEVVRRIKGIRGISNRIAVKATAQPTRADLEATIVRTLERSTEIDARNINVTLQGDTVGRAGQVRSWAEREDAERAARSTSGVARVENRLLVSGA